MDDVSLISIKCPDCGGQVKIRKEWEEGYCIYCGHKISNTYIKSLENLPSEPAHGGPVSADVIYNKINNALTGLYSLGRSSLKKAKLEILSRVDMEQANDGESKNKYAAELKGLCMSIGALPYEMTWNVWTGMKNAASRIYDGCAICTMYPEFSGAYLVSVEKLFDLTNMKWRSAFRKFGMFHSEWQEMNKIRDKTVMAKRWLLEPGRI